MNCQQTCLSDFLPLNNRLQISVGLFYEIISLRFLVCSLTHAHSNSHPTIDLCTTINTSDPNIFKVQYWKDTTLHETDPCSALCLVLKDWHLLCVCCSLWVYSGSALVICFKVWNRPVNFLIAYKPIRCIFQNKFITCRDIWSYFTSDLMVCFWNRGLHFMAALSAWGQLWVPHSRPKSDPQQT